jgi:hypothetical protein
MCIVYATGGPRRFDFGKAEHGGRPPAGATVFAACDGERVSQWLDDYTFDAMSDVEFYEMRGLVEEVERCEFIGRGCPFRKAVVR